VDDEQLVERYLLAVIETRKDSAKDRIATFAINGEIERMKKEVEVWKDLGNEVGVVRDFFAGIRLNRVLEMNPLFVE
jgi:hypothetical protein